MCIGAQALRHRPVVIRSSAERGVQFILENSKRTHLELIQTFNFLFPIHIIFRPPRLVPLNSNTERMLSAAYHVPRPVPAPLFHGLRHAQLSSNVTSTQFFCPHYSAIYQSQLQSPHHGHTSATAMHTLSIFAYRTTYC